MCPHTSVNITPTPENSWGIEDTYHITCTVCGQNLLAGGTIREIREFLSKNKYHVQSGKQYLSAGC